jgi:hypothetical protein
MEWNSMGIEPWVLLDACALIKKCPCGIPVAFDDVGGAWVLDIN